MVDFEALTDPHRKELLVYCYRMTGSIHDAEDLVQDTMLRAWRARETFDEDRASMRTWLYRIATNACLTALSGAQQRILPSGLSGASSEQVWPFPPIRREIAWLTPLPTDPAAEVADRDSVRLAFIVALQHLPPRQRAVLILRDVLAMPAAEVATQLDSSVASVNSALQRARAQLAEVAPTESSVPPVEAADRAMLERYMTAFIAGDIETLVTLLRKDVEMEMPPVDVWYSGVESVATFLSTRIGDQWRMIGIDVNGTPGIAAYRIKESGLLEAHQIQAISVVDGGVSRIVSFVDPTLFPKFGLPSVWSE